MGKNRAQSSARNFKTEADLAFWAGAMTEPTARPPAFGGRFWFGSLGHLPISFFESV
jgi:hypothetical protein